MSETTLIASAAFAAVAGLVYAYVGWRLSRRRVEGEAGLAAGLFSLWWYALGASSVITAGTTAHAALGGNEVALILAATYLNLLVVCIALWALLYYIVYIFTGRSSALWALTAFYLAYFMLLVYYVTASGPAGVQVESWRATLRYETPIDGPLVTILVVLLTFPQILASAAYGTLFFRVTEATQKYRVLLVSTSIIVWFLSAFLGAASGLAAQDWWQLLSRSIGLLATLTILAAYLPPAWVRRRFGVRSIADEEAQNAASTP
ncbi:MAG: hypothetical protein HY556_10230 [Euryarchaeota archaeon]|nr:hypothetical protein [Euryarchaeota archaeon]